MRELPREAVPALPRPAPALAAESRRIAHLLRQGHDRQALALLDALIAQIGATLAAAARRTGAAPQMHQVSSDLQEAALCQARADLIGLADVLEHRLAGSLGTLAG